MAKKTMKGRNFALTIILGVFIAIMVSVLFNLIVSYAYEPPKYEDFCGGAVDGRNAPYPIKAGVDTQSCLNCTYSKTLQQQVDACYSQRGNPVFEYDDLGCTQSLKECSLCAIEFEDATQIYNRNTFFVYAIIGFALIVFGLFVSPLLVQIATLPAGAFLVIEAAVKNFDNKLYVIITFALLIIAAVYLALKKLR